MRFSLCVLAVGLGIGVAAAGAAGAGSIVVRLQTDPAPARVAWSYSGVGQAFKLRASGSSRTISGLADGTYRLVETAAAGGPKTLTSLKCVDPSGGTTFDVAAATATIMLSSGETVTCTFTHRALGLRPAASAVQLAKKYAPVLRLASRERYRSAELEPPGPAFRRRRQDAGQWPSDQNQAADYQKGESFRRSGRFND